MTALRRIQKELKDIIEKPVNGVTVEPEEDNMFVWNCTVKGASDSPYKGGTFRFKLDLPSNFPFKAPSVSHAFHIELKSACGVFSANTLQTHTYPPDVSVFCVVFQTKVYHPGINEEGSICVPILRDEWKPSITLSTVLAIVQEKLNNPSPDDPYDAEIATLLKTDKAKFLTTAKEYTKKHAM